MGLHRLYWIPSGAGARDGVYVRYRPEEMYAILSLESHRQESVIVGENLGIVPDRVNTALGEHGIAKMYVLAIELKADERRPYRPIGRRVVASFGTHDLPTFASFWQGDDLEERVRFGVLTPEREPVERAQREKAKAALVRYLRRGGLLGAEVDIAAIYRACLALLATSPAERVLVNLEDLWQESRPQNVPGTMSDKHPNWRRRARYALEEHDAAPGVEEALETLRRYRGGRREPRAVPARRVGVKAHG
jgi:4-alpha-glucanotransferase